MSVGQRTEGGPGSDRRTPAGGLRPNPFDAGAGGPPGGADHGPVRGKDGTADHATASNLVVGENTDHTGGFGRIGSRRIGMRPRALIVALMVVQRFVPDRIHRQSAPQQDEDDAQERCQRPAEVSDPSGAKILQTHCNARDEEASGKDRVGEFTKNILLQRQQRMARTIPVSNDEHRVVGAPRNRTALSASPVLLSPPSQS